MPNFRARLWPPGTTRIRTLGWAAVIGLIAIALLAPASPALSNDTPGNNGTVKIHEGNTENDPGEVRNEPHVCTFHLHFYFSDPEQAGTWEIQEWSPGDKGTVVLSGTYDTQGDGEDRQPADGVYMLDPGHYKLFWDGDLDTEKHDKMKVFWVDCESSTTTTATETTTSGTETTASGTETTTSGTQTVSGTTTASETTTSGTETTTSGTETTTTGTGTQTVSATTTTDTSTGTASSSTSTSFSQTLSGITTTGGPTLPNTATANDATAPTSGGSSSFLFSALAFAVGTILLLTPSRERKRR